MEGVIPLTDSRLRPDIRAMEMGDIGTGLQVALVARTIAVASAPSAGVQVSQCGNSGVCDDSFYRPGECREEKTGGKAKSRPEKPH